VMEELLRKLPGLQINQDGTIKVNGETVKRILIDGKPFFGDDPKLAIKNLSASIVDKVQLINQKSDQAIFTGMDDGKREKAINITVKEDQKNNFLGHISLGYGTNERYAANGNLSRFSDEEQVSFIGNANNVNNPGFLNGSGEQASTESGLANNWNAGINYSKTLSKKIKMNGSYTMSKSNVGNEQKIARQNLLPDTTYYYNQLVYSTDKNEGHALDARLEYRPDTMHIFAVTTNIRYAKGNKKQSSIYETLNSSQQLVNSGILNNNSNNSTPNIYSAFFFDKKFKKIGRSLNTSVSLSYNNNEQENFNRSNNFFVNAGNSVRDTLNQKINIHNPADIFSWSVIYTEPVFKNHYLGVGYTYTLNETRSDKITYDYNVDKNVYNQLNDSLSNYFFSTYALHQAFIRLAGQKDKYDYSLGMYVQASSLKNRSNKQDQFKQSSTNLLPSVIFNYAFANHQRLHFLYYGSIQQPGIIQLQPVPDNSNPLYIQLGNPDLKQVFIHNANLSYNSFNPATMYGLSLDANIAVARNKIIEASWIDSLGRQISQPLNVNGAYDININVVNTIPLKKLHTSINSNTTVAFNKDVNLINKRKGSIRDLSITQGLSFNYSYKKLFEVSAAAAGSYNRLWYTIQKDNNARYFNYTVSFIGSANLPYGFIVGGSFYYILNAGRAAAYNQNVNLLNAFIAKNVFRYKQGVFKLQGFDLLNSNKSINRNVGQSYIEDVQGQVLQQFFMLSFSYFLKPQKDNK